MSAPWRSRRPLGSHPQISATGSRCYLYWGSPGSRRPRRAGAPARRLPYTCPQTACLSGLTDSRERAAWCLSCGSHSSEYLCATLSACFTRTGPRATVESSSGSWFWQVEPGSLRWRRACPGSRRLTLGSSVGLYALSKSLMSR